MNETDVRSNTRRERDAAQPRPGAVPLRRAVPPPGAHELRVDAPAAEPWRLADVEQFRCAATLWRVRPGWKEVLFGPDGWRLPEWLAANQATIVKSRSHRTVYRVELPDASFYVKEYRSLGWRDLLRDALRGNRALREWRRLLRVRARGIATVTALAIGVPGRLRRGAQAWLITAAAPGQPLDHCLENVLPTLGPAQRARARQHLAPHLARFVASMHEAGIVHRDLHPGNLLVDAPLLQPLSPRQGDAGSPTTKAGRELVLVDLQAVSLRRAKTHLPGTSGAVAPGFSAPLDWRASRSNLITLNLYFSQRATRSDRCRFWRHYVLCRPGLVTDPRAAARALEQQTARAARRFWERRDRRCMRQGRYFYRRVRNGAHALAVRDFPVQRLDALLASLDAPLEDADAQVLKRSSGSQVARLDLPDGPGVLRCIYKRWRPRNVREILLSWLRTSKAMHAWRMGHALRQRGIATPRPLAVIERRTLTRGVCSYVLWEQISDAKHLHRVAERLSMLPRRRGRHALRGLASRLARLLRSLHQAGFGHRDLKAANILVQGPPEAPNGIYLLDLDAASHHRAVPWRRRLRDLSRLLVSFTQGTTVNRAAKLRFFDAYLHGGLDRAGHWKTQCRCLDGLAQRKMRRNRRRGRVIA